MPLADNPPFYLVVFWGLVTFSLLVIIHEGGHFFAARFFGVRVHEFMLGLPGPALRWRSKRTGISYGVTAIPLGGYVRIAGMEPGAEDELLGPALKAVAVAGTLDADGLAYGLQVPVDRAVTLLTTLDDWNSIEKVKDTDGVYRSLVTADSSTDPAELIGTERASTYRGLPTWKRIVVLAMGVIMNLVTAVLLFTVTLSAFGYQQPSLVLANVEPSSPAVAAGLRAGDRLTAMDGQKVGDWPALLALIEKSAAGRQVSVAFVRGGKPMTVQATLGSREGRAFLGVRATIETVRLSVPAALGQSFIWMGMIFVAIGQFFDPSTFQQSVSGARSVVGISLETARAASQGPLPYIWMVALLSLSLGVMNILPIPPLDGGKIAVEIVERIMRRPLPRAVSLGLSLAGALLLFSLIGYLMYADVARMVTGG
jgi:regulator of sigma E protease